MTSYTDRLSQRALDTTRPALAHQSRGRPLTAQENALADALSAIYGTGQHDFAAVAAELGKRGVVAPVSGRTDWSLDLLEAELTALNADLDAAYRDHGYGA
jgi:hypothetical protein